MSPREVTNVAASVRQRLLNLARERGEEFQLVLMRFALERFLFRLGISQHADRLVLKGALLFAAWSDAPHRATRDADFLGSGDNTPDAVMTLVREVISGSPVEDDGIAFPLESMTAERMGEDREYEGIRIRLDADLDGAQIPVLLDIGFGDAVGVPLDLIDFPTLLDHEPPRVRAYPPEVVIAEKFEAMVKLGIANTRMKDLSDVAEMSQSMAFDGERLIAAVSATFQRRGTAMPKTPAVFTSAFAEDPAKRAQWRAFQRRIGASDGDLRMVTEQLHDFLGPIADAVRLGNEPSGKWKGSSWTGMMAVRMPDGTEDELRERRRALMEMEINLTPEDLAEMRKPRTFDEEADR